MKKYSLLTILTALIIMVASVSLAHAEVIDPYGEGEIGLHAAVLCAELSLREAPSTSSRVIQTLKYGDFILVTEERDGWARCVLGDAEDAAAGWVNADYIVVDPTWYRTEEQTPVYAWNDTLAPKVALLDANTELFDPETFLPVLKDEGEWLLVSLRGAVGWIHR